MWSFLSLSSSEPESIISVKATGAAAASELAFLVAVIELTIGAAGSVT